MARGFEFNVEIDGPRPPCWTVAEYLWGAGVDFDSDGNSQTPDDPNWTELTVAKRPDCLERIDVDLLSESPLVLKVRSESRELAFKAATYIATAANGRVVT